MLLEDINMQPVTLSEKEKAKVLKSFTVNTQAYRLVKFLSEQARVPVSTLNQKCSIGNIADIAQKHNSILRKYRLAIGCHRPPAPYLNQFCQPSNMQEWSLCRLKKHQLDLPIKGPDRPRVKDSLFQKRRMIIIDKTGEGKSLNNLLIASRSIGEKSNSRAGGEL